MKQTSTLFLKSIIFMVGVLTLLGLLWFPQTEGRAVGLDLFSIYADPVIIYTYIAAIPFFVGLLQGVNLLNLIDKGRAFSQDAISTLKNIRFASLVLIGLIAAGLLYLRFFTQGDDLAGPTMLGICLSLAFAVVATAASIFQKLLQSAVDIKSENDLTV